jgi:hypothetical protein
VLSIDFETPGEKIFPLNDRTGIFYWLLQEENLFNKTSFFEESGELLSRSRYSTTSFWIFLFFASYLNNLERLEEKINNLFFVNFDLQHLLLADVRSVCMFAKTTCFLP